MKNKKSVVHLAEEDKVDERKVVVVLQKANLQTATLKQRQTVLLNGEDHAEYIKNKLHKDPADFRPDITHQSLLSLMDSPLNKSGKLEVFITTTTNQVIKINPATKIPRTFKRFGPLMAQLLKKLTIRADQNGEILLKIVQSPVTNHLPEGCAKIALSTKAKLVKSFDFVKQLNVKGPIVFLVGAVAKGNPTMQAGYADESICISKYALSASKCIERLLHCFEIVWEIQ